MASLKKEAEGYESQRVKNIADLESVPIDIEMGIHVFKKRKIDEHGEEVEVDDPVRVVVVDGEEYRVPVSVLKQLKVVLEDNPTLKKFKVKRAGTGMSTEYIVIPILKM